MKVKIIEDQCIGCGYCEGVCDEVFKVEDISHVLVDKVPDEFKDQVIEAIEGCPTNAIQEVFEIQE